MNPTFIMMVGLPYIGEKMYNDVMALHEADIKAKGTDAEDAA